VVGGGRNRGSSSSVGVLHDVIGSQGIGKLSKDMPDTMMTRLVECVTSEVES